MAKVFFIYLVLCYLFFLIRDFIKFIKIKKGFHYTVYYCENKLGHVFSVSGDIGSGKTTGTAGIITCLEFILINKIKNIMKKSFLNLYDFDFNELDKIIVTAYEDNIDKYKLLDLFLTEIDPDIKRGNDIDKDTIKTLLNDYIEAIYRKLDNNFVISNFPFKSNVTNSLSKEYKCSYLNLKDIFNEENILYPVENFTIVAIDEANTDSNKKSTNFYSYSKEDNGFSIALRLARNMHKGTFYLIYIMQNVERLIKEEREVFVNNLLMNGLEIVNYFNFLQIFINLFQSINRLFENTVAFFHFKKKEIYLKSSNIFRKIRYKLSLLSNKLYMKSYVIYNVKNYKHVDDIGKENSDDHIYYDDFNFIFPINYVFGPVDTYYYKFIQEYLEKNSNLKFKDLNQLIESSLLNDLEQEVLVNDLLNKDKNTKGGF